MLTRVDMRSERTVLIIALTALLGGCSTLAYYGQAVHGELAILDAARPIDKVINDPATRPELRKKLEDARAIRAYASRQLGLPDDDSYRSFVALHRAFPIWNVVATPEFSLTPEQWCFPFAGCVPYRGYFSRDAAERFAQSQRVKGMDVMVGPVPAFSTLGWLDDPLLSSMLYWSEPELAEIIFHELTHRLIYVKDAPDFNEALATFVSETGVHRWLLAQTDGKEKYKAWVDQNAHDAAVRMRIMQARAQLHALYAQKLPAAEMRAKKAHIFMQLYADYEQMKKRWPGYDGYDGFFSHPLSNALIGENDTYRRLIPAFHALFVEAGSNFPAFYKKVRELAALGADERKKALEQLLAQSTHAAPK